jgi:hypothetical protein
MARKMAADPPSGGHNPRRSTKKSHSMIQTRGASKKAAESPDNKGKIGWFRYYKPIEVILTDEHGIKTSIARHKWTKIPTPEKKESTPKKKKA